MFYRNILIHVNFLVASSMLFLFLVIECDSGTYGRDCEMNCSSNCLNKTCDVTDGTCAACMAGKKGSNCTEGN